VVVADVTNLPEDNEAADYYVLSQAIMGTNAEDYLREAHRVLRWDGILHIAETSSHFGEDVEVGLTAFTRHLESLGFSVLGDPVRIGAAPEFIVIEAIKRGAPAPVAQPWQWAHIA
jgi:ubiquinone/menaquinone biosynthesis C-methylase UbiE